jgi:fibronectin-binding autotransporter adhesin
MKKPALICSSLFRTPWLRLAQFLAGAAFAASPALHAADGTWVNPAGGSWPLNTNWAGNAIGDGVDFTANFGTLDLATDATVTLDGARTIGNLIFGDLTPSQNWFLNAGTGGALTLDVTAGTPTITVNNQTATIGAVLAGNDGLTKSGAGTLRLAGANTYTGNTVTNGGTLDIAAGGSITNATVVSTTNGGTLTISGSLTMANGGDFTAGSGIAGTTGTVVVNTGGVLSVGAGGGYAGIGGRNSLGAGLGSGTLTVNGGTVNIAAAGTGSSGPGGLDATSFWLNPYGSGGASTINLDAGILSTARPVNNGSANAFLNYNGGTFQATSSAASSNLTSRVRNGGAKIDTQAFNITLSGSLVHSDIAGDNATDGGLTKTGSGSLTLSSQGNTFNGNITINQGTLFAAVGNDRLDPTSGSLGNTQTVGRQIIVNAAGTLSFAGNDALGSTASTVKTAIIVNGGTVTNNGTKFVTLGPVTLNGGTLTGNGGANPSYQMFNLKGTVSVIGTVPSVMSGAGVSNGFHLAAPTTFDVADVTGSVASDLLITAPLINRTGNDGNAPGSLVKIGAGTILLSGANLYTGPTTVNAGTILMNGTMAAGNVVTVADNAGFGRCTSGALSLGSLTLGTGTSLFTNTGGLISVTTAGGFVTPAANNAVTVNISGSPTTGLYTLVSYSGAFAGTQSTFVLGSLPTRTLGSLVLDSTTLKFNVTTVDSARWSGAASSDWSTTALTPTTNWVLNSDGTTQTNYLATDTVSFTDSAPNLAVTITTADVTPGGVTFNNPTKNYTLGGAKGIAGGTSLIKAGAGTLTISNVNTYIGGTQLNGGVIETAAGGLGTVGPISFGGGILRYAAGNTADYSGRIANSTVPINIDTNGNDVTFASTINATNSGGLVKTGAGTLSLNSANSFTGDLVLNGGSIIANVSANNGNPTASALGNMTIAGRKVTINAGTSLTFGTFNDATGAYNYTTPVTFVVDGGTLSHGNQFLSIGNVELKNAATLTGINGASPIYSGFSLNGSVTVSGTGTSVLSTTGGSNPGTNLGTTAVAFVIGNTGGLLADFIVTSPLLRGATGGVGGLVKSGPGTMLLDYPAYAGSTLYDGNTVINEGKLLVNGALNPVTSVTVADGAGFGRTSSGSVTIASLTLANVASLNVAPGPDNATTGSIVVTGANGFVANGAAGSVTVNVGGGGLTQGSTYTLLNYEGSFNGTDATFALGTKPSRTTGNLVLNAANTSLDFVVTTVDSIRWTGAASANWSTAVLVPTTNFALQSDNSPTNFLVGDTVIFNDQATTTTLNLPTADVAPGAMKFDNANKAYTINGPKAIVSGSLTKTNTGDLTINNVNSYAGGTAINGGSITTGAGGLGTSGQISFGGGQLHYAAGNTQDISARIANSTGTIKLDIGANNVNFAAAIASSNTAGFVKDGSGTLTLASGSSGYLGDLIINAGTVSVTGGLNAPVSVVSALGNPQSVHQVVVNAGARLEYRQHDILGNDAANPLVTIVLNGGTLAAVSGQQAGGNGPFNILPAVMMNGGTLTSTNGAGANVQSFSLKGTITVGGNTPSLINTTGTAALLNGIHLTQTGGNIFDVGDATNSPAIDLEASGRLINRAGDGAASALIKRGAGTMQLSNAANAYTGATTVEAGTLLLAGSISGSDVTVRDTASLGGTGTAKSIFINPGGSFSPSDVLTPGSGLGTFTLGSDAALFGTATFDIKKTGSTLSSDLLSSGTQIVYGGILNVVASGNALASGDRFNLFDAPELGNGIFDTVNLPGFSDPNLQWDTTGLTVDGTILVVPEPGSALLLLGGLGALVGCRRRRAV